MKNLFLSVLFVALGFHVEAQKLVRLDELKMTMPSDNFKVDPGSSRLTFIIPQEYTGEFVKDALTFVKNKFDISEVIEANRDSEFDKYNITFKSSKGALRARYDADGNLRYSSQVFRNIAMPYPTTVEILKENRDWLLASNKRVSISKEWNITKEYYLVKLKKGKARKTVRLDMIPQKTQKLASI